jgi:hypothetical protein
MAAAQTTRGDPDTTLLAALRISQAETAVRGCACANLVVV